jgi:hypothetical protein
VNKILKTREATVPQQSQCWWRFVISTFKQRIYNPFITKKLPERAASLLFSLVHLEVVLSPTILPQSYLRIPEKSRLWVFQNSTTETTPKALVQFFRGLKTDIRPLTRIRSDQWYYGSKLTGEPDQP